MHISQLADEFLGSEYQNLIDAGPSTKNLHGLIGNETRTEPLIATMFWQAFIASPAFLRVMSRCGASPAAYLQGDKFVVQHRGRLDLIVFDPEPREATLDTPIVVQSVEATPEDLRTGLRRYNDDDFTLGQTRYFGYRAKIALEVLRTISFGLLVVPQPKRDYTSFVPHPPVKIAVGRTLSRTPVATAGVVATDAERDTGVTTALHAINGESDVMVDTLQGKVKSIDSVTDSCFITVSQCPPSTRRNIPLTGMTPRIGETVNFDGMTSGSVDTIVTAWSPELPLVMKGSQTKLLTPPVTQPGDSGAALVDSDGRLLGFAFYRTGFGEKIEFSAWIWSESVFLAHRLA